MPAVIRVLYLLAIAVGVFFLPQWWMVGGAVLLQVALWLALRQPLAGLVRQLKKLFLFLALILLSYSLVTVEGDADQWRTIDAVWFQFDVNVTGFFFGLTMILRVVAIVFASLVIRVGDPKALIQGLQTIGLPKTAALSIDTVLTLLGDSGDKSGSGKGTGGGEGKRKKKSFRGFSQGIKRLAKGDVAVIAGRLRKQIDRVESHLDQEKGEKTDHGRDVAIISAIALTMLSIKMLKLLPGLPFAPGHKGVILIPLYIVAGYLTKGKAGATLTGLVMGTAAFLLGDGRYGVFEIAKHIAPGILTDLFMPFLRRSFNRSVLVWAALGMLIALGRFATVTAIALTVQAPALVYAFLVPGLVVHATFGAISGILTAPLLRATLAPVQDTTTQADPPPRPGSGKGTGQGQRKKRQEQRENKDGKRNK